MVEVSFERLYLSKDSKDSKQDIYVDKCPLVQHQLDGVRFLYRALKKKKQAVIVNDQSGYGKRVQTVLFLSAVLPTLSKPVLILCREGKEQHWISCFQRWTKVSDDVAIELSNPFTKKKVLISAPYCAAAFARRQWSVLVVDDDLISKDIQKSSLRADLRIWITSSPMKEDLTKFSTFHSWVFPKEKFVCDKYKANTSDLSDVLTKTAMLDAFLEDTVLRRDCGRAPFTKTQVSISNNITETRSTKKNKDATGTKIKRSKRKSTDNYDASKVSRTNKTENTKEKNTEVFEIGLVVEKSIIKEAKTSKENIAKDCEMGDITQSDEENVAPCSRCKRKRPINLWDSESSEDEQDNATNVEIDKNKDRNDTVSQLDESEEQLNALRWDSDITQSELTNQETPTKNENKDVIVKKDPENNGKFLENDQNPIESLHKFDVDNEINDEINPVVNDGINFSEDLFSTDLTTNPNEINVKEIIFETENEQSTEPIKQDELIDKTDQKKPESANLSSFEIKLKELEELTLKKYKGSFLDSIF